MPLPPHLAPGVTVEAQATGTFSDLPPHPGFADGQPPDQALQPSAQSPGAYSNTSSLTCIRSLFQNFSYTCSDAQTQGVSRTRVTVRPTSSAGWVLLALHRHCQTTAGGHRLLRKLFILGPSYLAGQPHRLSTACIFARPPAAS